MLGKKYPSLHTRHSSKEFQLWSSCIEWHLRHQCHRDLSALEDGTAQRTGSLAVDIGTLGCVKVVLLFDWQNGHILYLLCSQLLIISTHVMIAYKAWISLRDWYPCDSAMASHMTKKSELRKLIWHRVYLHRVLTNNPQIMCRMLQSSSWTAGNHSVTKPHLHLLSPKAFLKDSWPWKSHWLVVLNESVPRKWCSVPTWSLNSTEPACLSFFRGYTWTNIHTPTDWHF